VDAASVPVEPNTGIYADIEVLQPPDGDVRPGRVKSQQVVYDVIVIRRCRIRR
jgi:hypothetical protein